MRMHAYSVMMGVAIMVIGITAIAAWQKKGEGVRISYQVAPAITLHEPVIIHARFVNEQSKPIILDLGFNRKNGFHFSVIEPGGQRVELEPLSEEGVDAGGIVRLGERQIYSQRLILDEWYEFRWPGDYLVEVRCEAAMATQNEGMLHIKILPRSECVLQQRCTELIQQLKKTRSFPKRSEIARELSYVKDPVGIPYIASLIEEREDYYAIAGLMRIGTDEAMEAMIPATQSEDVESARYARGLLRQMLPKIRNAEIREKVKAVIRNR